MEVRESLESRTAFARVSGMAIRHEMFKAILFTGSPIVFMIIIRYCNGLFEDLNAPYDCSNIKIS